MFSDYYDDAVSATEYAALKKEFDTARDEIERYKAVIERALHNNLADPITRLALSNVLEQLKADKEVGVCETD